MDATFQAALQPVVDGVMSEHGVPGMVIVAQQRGQAPHYFVTGSDAQGNLLTKDYLLPIASIGKLAVALAVLRLKERGDLGLDEPLGEHLAEVVAAHPGLTLRTLLCHTSGYPFYYSFEDFPYTADFTWEQMKAACKQTELEVETGSRVGYSELNCILLAAVVEEKMGMGIYEALQTLVFKPLGIEAYLGMLPPRPVAYVINDESPLNGTPLEQYNSDFHRQLENPSDGIMTTAEGSLKLVGAFIDDEGGFLSAATLAEARRNQVGDLGGGFIGLMEWPWCPWGLGPQLATEEPPHPAAGSLSHMGLSGCLAWASPAMGLTLSVHGTKALTSWFGTLENVMGAAMMAVMADSSG
ncbi:MAG TPA: serine hydrolase domain-containing protein [Anaerolineae bacterium]|nr:serine hydrolase domain-containing protein [Anaerolineae bacterium]